MGSRATRGMSRRRGGAFLPKPAARHNYPPEKFPITLQLYSGKTDEIVWSRTVSLEEARALTKIEIPSYKDTEHYPVRAEVIFADGTSGIGDLQ